MKMAWWGIDMKLRLAEMADLPQLKAVYKEIIRNMDENGVPRAKQKEVLDQVAAQVILEDYLRTKKE